MCGWANKVGFFVKCGRDYPFRHGVCPLRKEFIRTRNLLISSPNSYSLSCLVAGRSLISTQLENFLMRSPMDYLQEDHVYPLPPSLPHDQPIDPQFVTMGAHPPHPPASTLPAYQTDPYDGMPPPPTGGEFPDLPSLMKACQEHAKRHGYACVTSSNNYKRGIAYVRCDRGGEYVNHWHLTDETRVRKNRTRRLVGCTWKARAKRTATGTWVMTMMNSKHSGHSASDSPTSHPSQRQLTAEAVEEAREAFRAGMSPKEVLELMRTRYNEAITAQDVYNLKAKIARMDQRAAAAASARESAPHQSHEQQEQAPTPVAIDPNTDPMLQHMQLNPTAATGGGEGRAERCECDCCHH